MKFPVLLLTALALATAAHARIVTRSVGYEHDGVSLKGYLAYDDSMVNSAPVPGVLVIPEWWGLNDYPKSRAEKLAALGYVAFVADMYGDGQTTLDPKRAGELAGQFYGKPLMAARAQAGLDQLLKTGHVDPKRVAAIGYCFGGSTVQALAFSGAPIAGVVSFHGSLLPVPADAATKVKAKLLVCHGGADAFVSPESLHSFTKDIEEAKLDYVFITYAGAVHAFTNPQADAVAKSAGLKGIGYNADADRRSWEHMKTFFAEIFSAK